MVGGRKTFSPDEIHAWLKEELSTENNKHKTFGQVLGTAAVQYNKMTNSMYLHTFDAEKDIVKVQSQVVQGTMYYVTVNMHPTECRKTEENVRMLLANTVYMSLAYNIPYIPYVTVFQILTVKTFFSMI